MIRYQALDRCFSNWARNFYIEDLIEACNKALYDYTGDEKSSIQRRQIFNDISFMESAAGWDIPLDRLKDGKRVYYRYSDKNFTINNQPLSKAELDQLKEATYTLARFKGVPSFEWVEEIISKLEDKFKLVGNSTSVIDFEQNIYLKGLEYLSPLFNSIVNKQCLQVRYRNFEGETFVWDIHPYYIKQYNTRWFLLALNEKHQSITNIPLDRIEECMPIGLKYKSTDIDFADYFDDIVGVTFPQKLKMEVVLLRFAQERFPYVTSKPLHHSQKIVCRAECTISIEVVPNKELEQLLLSFGHQVEVLSPQSLRETMKENIAKLSKMYFSVQNDCTE